MPVQFDAHLRLKIGAPKHRDGCGRTALEFAGQGQRGDVLLECRGKADNIVKIEIDPVVAFLDKNRTEIAAPLKLSQKVFRIWSEIVRDTGFEVFERRRIFTVQRGGKDETAPQVVRGRMLADPLIDSPPTHAAQTQTQIPNITVNT